MTATRRCPARFWAASPGVISAETAPKTPNAARTAINASPIPAVRLALRSVCVVLIMMMLLCRSVSCAAWLLVVWRRCGASVAW